MNSINDHLMSTTIAIGWTSIHIVSVYTPSRAARNKGRVLWKYIPAETARQKGKFYVLGGDLNVHAGQTNSTYTCYGNLVFGKLNMKRERILDFAEAFDFEMLNTHFKKPVISSVKRAE